jgi:hypothetical protein
MFAIVVCAGWLVGSSVPCAARQSDAVSVDTRSTAVHNDRLTFMAGDTADPPVILEPVIVCCRGRAVAQEPSHRFWLGVGVGGAGTAEADGVGVLGQLVYERAPHHFAFRVIALADVSSGADAGMGEAGVLYGRMIGGGIAAAYASAGLSYVHVDRCDATTTESCGTVGVPLAAEVMLTPFDVIGIGLQAFANINPKASYAGVLVTLPIGWMP